MQAPLYCPDFAIPTLESLERRVLLAGMADALPDGELAIAGSAVTVFFFVDLNNATGTEDGSAAHPFNTIAEALAEVAGLSSVAGGAAIKVAQGEYAESLALPNVDLQLRGGFAGATAEAYGQGESGDFSAAAPGTNVTRIIGASDPPVILLENVAARIFVIDGFTISGGHTGIYCEADYLQFSKLTISHNIIENNGPAELQADGGTYYSRGGGIYSSNATLTVANNIIRNNNSNRGGGIFVASKTAYTITDNVIEDNSGYDDHGGGVFLVPLAKSASGSATFSRNIVRGNVAAKAFGYGWGGGILIAGDLNPKQLKPVKLGGNTVSGNSAPSLGGGIFVDNGATATINGNVVYGNTASVGGSGIYVDGDGGGVGSFVTITNSIIADHPAGAGQVGNGIYVEEFSKVTIANSIFWENGGDDLFRDSTSTLTLKCSISQEKFAGTGNSRVNPRFADPAAGDYRPGRLPTFTTIAITPLAARPGAKATLTATVAIIGPIFSTFQTAASAPVGKVHFFDGAREIGSGVLRLNAGTGNVKLVYKNLKAGLHPIKARYAGKLAGGTLAPALSVSTSKIVTLKVR